MGNTHEAITQPVGTTLPHIVDDSSYFSLIIPKTPPPKCFDDAKEDLIPPELRGSVATTLEELDFLDQYDLLWPKVGK